MLRQIIACALVMFPLASQGQNLSVADIAAMVDEAQDGNNDYRKLLNDPDPERARLAMTIMLEKGDKTLQRIALDHGLYSTDAVVRRLALEAHLRSGAFLAIRADGSQIVENGDGGTLNYEVQRAGGTVSGAGDVQLNHQLGDFDDKKNCILYNGSTTCAIRISDAAISFNHSSKWTELTLDADAVLRGGININRIGVLPVEIPISP